MTMTNEGENIQLPAGVDRKYADTSNLGLLLSDTPEQVAADKVRAEHLQEVSRAVNLNHIAALARLANPDSRPKPSPAVLDTIPLDGRFIRTGNRMPLEEYRRRMSLPDQSDPSH